MTQALYRRYRPATFAEVIGQDHVTGPLQQALSNERTHHAYLFSGPRGCGKTTSARIMARCLNCEQGPTATPCGECQSCRDLAPGGGGSLDVIELDAATHGLVDDARDLRERAFFAPAGSRFKVYIIDEAHMLGPGAANALLKIVEEPPPHVKFVFATTEPDKLISTIRSRVHHYPFRLVPPGELATYLASVCEQEGVTADRGAIALVVRAGRGSVRDAMSLLDQLISGAPDEGITYEYASALLGLTDAALLDDTVEAFAAGDAATVFQVVDRVVEAGHDPRRFAEDLLERLRDLIVIAAVPDAAGAILGDRPADELDRMRRQASVFGSAELSRAADVVNAGLTEMRGATAPRLQLELICARVLLPGADDGTRGLAARIDRLERRAAIADAPAPREPAATPTTRAAAEQSPAAAASAPTLSPPPAPGPATVAEPPAAGESGLDLVTVRREWPEVLRAVADLKRSTWALVSQNSSVQDVGDGRLTLGFSTAGQRDVFLGRSDHQDYLREALLKVLGVDWKVDAIVDPTAASRTAPQSPARPAPTTEKAPSGRAAAEAAVAAETAAVREPDDAPSVHDADADEGDGSHHDLLARTLGAKVIGEYDES